MDNNNETYTIDGRVYSLLQQPYISDRLGDAGNRYLALASDVDNGDTVMLAWDVFPDYDSSNGDESDACNWDRPYLV